MYIRSTICKYVNIHALFLLKKMIHVKLKSMEGCAPQAENVYIYRIQWQRWASIADSWGIVALPFMKRSFVVRKHFSKLLYLILFCNTEHESL